MSLFWRATKWTTEMQGYDFEVTYKKRKDNIVVDALSR